MIGNSKSEGKYLLRKILVNICFGKVTDPQPAPLSKKMNPITGTFQAICLHLRSPCFKVHLKKKSSKIEIQCIYYVLLHLLFIFSRCSLYVWPTNGQLFANTKKNCLINSVCFWLRSMKKKGKHGNYRVKIHSGKCNAWDMKIYTLLYF